MAYEEWEPVVERHEAFGDVGEQRVSFQKSQETSLLAPSTSENRYYSELLQGFFQQMERWHNVVVVPAYFIGHYRQEGQIDEQSTWGFDITYPGDRLDVIPKHNRALSKETVRVMGISAIEHNGMTKLSSISVGAGFYNETFIDPYTKSLLSAAEIYVRKYRYSHSHVLTVGGVYYDHHDHTHIKRAISYGFTADGLRIGPEEYGSFSRDAELISDDHAKALFELVDSVIPQKEPTVGQE